MAQIDRGYVKTSCRNGNEQFRYSARRSSESFVLAGPSHGRDVARHASGTAFSHLFDDTDKNAAEALRTSVVAQAHRSPAAVTKQTTGLTPDGLPVHSFRSLLADLATLARNTVTTDITPNYPFTVLTRPTAIQHKAFALLAVTCSQ